uniref:Uncharacterized protein n=1 Tax=Onchocerca volvulus TaxID=6282 RepID=A0A8R1TWA6_ONCVO
MNCDHMYWPAAFTKLSFDDVAIYLRFSINCKYNASFKNLKTIDDQATTSVQLCNRFGPLTGMTIKKERSTS